MPTYVELMAQIEALQKQAEEVRQAEIAGVIAEIRQKIQDYDLTAVDLLAIDAAQFTAEIFVAGNARTRCKIWIGGLAGGNEIAYSEGSMSQSSNSMNEALSLTGKYR